MKHLALMLVWLAAVGCGAEAKAPGPVVMNDMDLENWQIALVEMRIDKNEAFMDTTSTALRLEDLAGFEGLNYYDPDPTLRFRVQLQREASPDTVFLQKRRGQQVPYVKEGKVAFTRAGRVHVLSVFGPAEPGAEKFLWLPFTDETTGRETYGGGRYLDLTLEGDGSSLVLDFNYAYNPLCDYNPEKYNCTLPPTENRLPFAVKAGEQLFRPQAAGAGQ